MMPSSRRFPGTALIELRALADQLRASVVQHVQTLLFADDLPSASTPWIWNTLFIRSTRWSGSARSGQADGNAFGNLETGGGRGYSPACSY